MPTYVWKSGSRLTHLDSAQCGRELESLEHDGPLTPPRIVARAADPTSALHGGFTWDDTAAADKCRLIEAQYLARHLVLVQTAPDGAELLRVRAFVSIVEAVDEQTAVRRYASIDVALRDPVLRAQVLAQATREIEQWRRRYAELSELAAIFDAIDVAVPPTPAPAAEAPRRRPRSQKQPTPPQEATA